MDSGNSGGSLQSSSGDEEYDSRANSISALINNNIIHTNPLSNPQPPLNTTINSNCSTMFDPLSNYFSTISRPPQSQQSLQTPNSLLNLDMSWSKTLRSEPNSTDINNSIMISASQFQSLFGSKQPHGSCSQSQSPAVSIPPVPENTSAANTPRAAVQDQNNPAHVVRNPKKRSRASRRAPTTVLTTDTTNFRAMVQEFTGIPAPPFTSPFPRSRLDLYGTPSMRSSPLDSPQPPYLRRPFPQKVQLPPPPFLATSSSSPSLLLNSSVVDHAIASTNATNSINSSSTSSTAALSYQLLTPQNANLFNMPNPLLTSLLQSNPTKFPPSNSSIIGLKTPQGSLEIPSNDSQLKVGMLDEFGLSHGHVNTTSLSGLPGLISSDQTTSRNDNNLANWGSGVGSNDGDQGHQVRSGNGNLNLAANGKLNYSSSSSGFRGDKGSDNVAVAPPRGEGMMESWICSSD